MSLFWGSKKVILKKDNSYLRFQVNDFLPGIYQRVDWIKAEDGVGAYIDLGFAFDTKATISMSQYISDTGTNAYPFGAAENNGTIRCCLSSPYVGNGTNTSTFYGSNGNSYISSSINVVTGANKMEMVIEEGNLTLTNLSTDDVYKNTQQAAYTMTNNLYLFAQNYNGTARFGGVRKIGCFKYRDKDNKLICNLIPCYRKSDGVVGMYNTVNGAFLTNVGAGEFVAGNEAGNYIGASFITLDGQVLRDSNNRVLTARNTESVGINYDITYLKLQWG